MPSPHANPHAAALAKPKAWVLAGSALAFTGMVGFQLAIEVYSGPSIAVGLLISIGTAVALWLTLVSLPERGRIVLACLASVLL